MTLDEIGDTMAAAVDTWMTTVQTLPPLHWANIALGATLGGTNAVTGIHRFADGMGAAKSTIAAYLTLGTSLLPSLASSSAMRAIANVANAVSDELKDPNIEGIPIHAVKENDSRDVDVNAQLVITQSSANKNYVVDNATPQLKQWQISGYLTSLPEGLDPFLIIKPGLKVQKLLLDAYAKTRRPVWFKTHDGSFEKVLIKHIDTTYDPQYLNGLAINISLVEFKVMETEATTIASILGKLKS